MSEMIERVSAVLESAGVGWLEQNDPKRRTLGWSDIPNEIFARAAIVAMKEPTGEMLDAACEVGPDTNAGEFSVDDARRVYTALIDAALTDGGE